jgi:hypothetical protein
MRLGGICHGQAGVAELVDASDTKCRSQRGVGSFPAARITIVASTFPGIMLNKRRQNLGSLLAAATALPAVVHRPVHVRVAVCRQVARQATCRKIGVNTMARTSEKSPKVAKKLAAKQVTTKRVLLSGGNPQIAKGDGDAPVQAYIAAMPGWKRDVGRRLDALIVRTVPGVRKTVKWNSPFYGVEGQGWFLGIHCFAKYVKVAFFRGASLRPIPPGESKQKEVRYLDIHEDDELDEAQLAAWVKQATLLPRKQL